MNFNVINSVNAIINNELNIVNPAVVLFFTE